MRLASQGLGMKKTPTVYPLALALFALPTPAMMTSGTDDQLGPWRQ
jgi:hypothetical protein